MQKRLHNSVSSHKCGSFIVIWTIFLFMLICLLGCAHEPTTTELATNTAHQTIQTIRESLPDQCKTPAVTEQLKTADSAIDTVESACNTRIEVLTQEKLRWKWGFFGLIFMIGFYIAKKIIK